MPHQSSLIGSFGGFAGREEEGGSEKTESGRANCTFKLAVTISAFIREMSSEIDARSGGDELSTLDLFERVLRQILMLHSLRPRADHKLPQRVVLLLP